VSSVFGTAGNWLGGVAPVNNDTVYITGTVAITGVATLLTGITLIVEDGYTGPTIGTGVLPLSITCASFTYNSSQGVHYFDLLTSAIAVNILNAPGQASSTTYGLNIKGSALTTMTIGGGSVAIAGQENETAVVATINTTGSGTSVLAGNGVTATTITHSGGTFMQECISTTTTVHSGTYTTRKTGTLTAGTIATLNVNGGIVYPESTGLISTLNINGGFVNMLGNRLAKTISAVKLNPPGSFAYDPSVHTISAWTAPDYQSKLVSSKP
jgi:hypothetical protein